MKKQNMALCLAAVLVLSILAGCGSNPSAAATPSPPPTDEAEVFEVPEFSPEEPVVISTIKMLTEKAGWATGGETNPGDLVLVTQDGGNTWIDVSPPEAESGDVGKTAYGFFLDVDTAWVTYGYVDTFSIPENPVVWHTGDGGRSWEAGGTLDTGDLAEFYSPQHFTFVDEDHGWLMVIVGAGMNKAYFYLYQTEDGGVNWTRIQDPTTNSGMDSCPKTGMVFGDANTGLVTRDCAGLYDGAHLFGTGNGGELWNWFELPPPESAPDGLMMPNHMCRTHSPTFTSPTSGLVAVSCKGFNDDGTKTETHYIYTTSDSGLSWQGGTPYPGGEIVVMGDGYAFALGKDISRSSDFGESWEYVSSIDWEGQFSFIDPQRGWAVARGDGNVTLMKTSDGGAMWDLLAPVVVK
ncbi:MAG: hypothetical protein PVF83_00600 [Anaerolineales bacterium]|jgi:photosystem II stability/assembly factor-like uncharacterized protein